MTRTVVTSAVLALVLLAVAAARRRRSDQGIDRSSTRLVRVGLKDGSSKIVRSSTVWDATNRSARESPSTVAPLAT